jgi:DNA modification methylase
MPESCKDRCTKSHEYLFLLSKSAKYYFNAKAIEEPAKWERWGNQTENKIHTGTAGHLGNKTLAELPIRDKKNKRSVWTIATKPYVGAHCAAFPPLLVEPCILAGSRIGDIVLDPFMGSGTTAQVAVQHGRHYLGCELNKEYKKLCDKRLKKDNQ